MAPKDDEQALGRVIMMAFKNRFVIGLLGLSLGGGSSTIMQKLVPPQPNPQMDTLLIAVKQIPGVMDTLKAHSASLRDLDVRVEELTPDNSRLAYAPRKPRGQGRWRE